MKKIALIVSALMLSGILAGCTPSENSEPNDSREETSSSEPSAPSSSSTPPESSSTSSSTSSSPSQSDTSGDTSKDANLDIELLKAAFNLKLSGYIHETIALPQDMLDSMGKTEREYILDWYKKDRTVIKEDKFESGLYMLSLEEDNDDVFLLAVLPECENKRAETAAAVELMASFYDSMLAESFADGFVKVKNNDFKDLCLVGFKDINDKWVQMNGVIWMDAECEAIYKQVTGQGTPESSSQSTTLSTPEYKEDKNVLYKTDDFHIKFLDWEKTSTGSIDLKLSVENHTKKDYYIEFEDICVNDYQFPVVIGGSCKSLSGKS